MSADYLADPNEAAEAADYYLHKFSTSGAIAGDELDLVVCVSNIARSKLAAVESDVRTLYDCESVERGERGFIFKKATLVARLKPMRLERENLLKASQTLYRIILDHGVAVEIRRA